VALALALGHVEPRKNLGLVIEALALDRELPPLVVAGRPRGDERQRTPRWRGVYSGTSGDTGIARFAR